MEMRVKYKYETEDSYNKLDIDCAAERIFNYDSPLFKTFDNLVLRTTIFESNGIMIINYMLEYIKCI